MFDIKGDPESLTQFVHCCQDRGVSIGQLVQSLRQAADVRSRFAILLALGDYRLADVEAADHDALVKQLAESYRSDPSSAIHGATGWLLKKWGKYDEVVKVDHERIPYDETDVREWYVAEIPVRVAAKDGDLTAEQRATGPSNQTIYITFVVFDPRDSFSDTGEHSAGVSIPRKFAVSDREIVWEQFDPSDDGRSHDQVTAPLGDKPLPEMPACGISWYMAVEYCRWLSQHARIPESNQCYEPRESLPRDEADNPLNWPIHLDRPGFRLLTEAEWEYACRSGTSTQYSFGNDASLLSKYGWFLDNAADRPHAVGLLRPNLRGLFDVHGNLHEWCHDWRGPDNTSDSRDAGGPSEGKSRRMRGGSDSMEARLCSSIWRDMRIPENRSTDQGFRIAVTLESLPSAESAGTKMDGQ